MKSIYVCCPLKSSKFPFNEIYKYVTKPGIFAFIPLPNPNLPMKKIIQLNKHHIINCDEVWVFGKYGKDCAWEQGFAQALGKPVRIFLTKKNLKSVMKDEMLKSCPITFEEIR